MAGPLIRLAAGGAAVIVFAILGGSGMAVSAADPGDPSHSSHSRQDGPSGAHGADRRHREADHRGTPNRGGGSRPSTIAGRTSPAVSAPNGATVSSPSVSTDQGAATVLPVKPVTGERGSSASTVNVEGRPDSAPTMTVGNGRSPGVPVVGPDEVATRDGPGSVIVPPPVAPALVLPAAPPSPVDRPEPPRSQTPVTSSWGTLNPGWPAGALFGIAGLLLAPIAGVWLGHRQARAAKAASQLVGS